jgi:hypothetical protein
LGPGKGEEIVTPMRRSRMTHVAVPPQELAPLYEEGRHGDARTVGIDVAIRGAHVATVFDGQGHPVGSPIRLRLRADALDGLIQTIRTGLLPTEPVVAVLEPTGMAWYPLARRLTQAGCSVIRVKGQRVKALRRYLSEYAKTDVTDAQVLARMPGFGRRGLPPLYVPTSQQQALNRLTKQRARTRRRRVRFVAGCWTSSAGRSPRSRPCCRRWGPR